ncbi:40383_t:CDS:2, partial [Gigaspora margarita]
VSDINFSIPSSSSSIDLEPINISEESLISEIDKTAESPAEINHNFHLSENFHLDYDNSFLEDQLDRPQISIMALIKDIDHNDIVEI